MNPRSPLTLCDLNHFAVLGVRTAGDRTELTGRLSQPGGYGPGDDVCLYVSLEEDVCGDLTVVDPDAGTAVLRTYSENFHPAVVVGASFPTCGSYWIDRIRLVLDHSTGWTPQRFVAPDAFVQPNPRGGRMWRVATPEDRERSDGQIVPGGWDHEHCEICWCHIDGDEPEGYVNATDQWVCPRCYQRYIEPGDLSFVVDGVTDEDAEAADDAIFVLNRLIDRYDVDGVREHLRKQGNFDLRRPDGWTPLMIAAKRGQRTLASMLLREGADVNAVSSGGYTVLAGAAQRGHVEMVEMLLRAGASVKVPETFFGGSLLLYVKTGLGPSDRILELLAQAGAE